MPKVRQIQENQTETRNGTSRRNILVNHLKNIAKDVPSVETFDETPDVSPYVQTLFPSFNMAVQLGGAPLRCIWLIHGPTEEGKSTFCAGLISAFQQQGHLTAYFDLEHGVLNKLWFSQLGVDPELLIFEQPDFGEDMVNRIDALITKYDELKESDPDLAMAIVIDSLSKITPKKEFETFIKLGAEAMDKGLARFRALFVQTWLDHMTPIIGKRDIALICIGQERMKQDAKLWEKEYRIKGCQGSAYDASVRARIQFGPLITIGEEKKKKVIGRKHDFYVFKNRVGYANERGAFYTSNGKGNLPIGFDYPREIIDVAIPMGIIQQAGAWYAYEGTRLGQGIENAVMYLHQQTKTTDEIRRRIQENIQTKRPRLG